MKYRVNIEMDIEATDIWEAIHAANGMMMIADQHAKPKKPIKWQCASVAKMEEE